MAFPKECGMVWEQRSYFFALPLYLMCICIIITSETLLLGRPAKVLKVFF